MLTIAQSEECLTFLNRKWLIKTKLINLMTKGRHQDTGIKTTPRTLLSLRNKGITYRNKTTTEIGFSLKSKIVVEQEKEYILNQYPGAEYRAKRGAIDLIFDATALTLLELSPMKLLHTHLGLFLLTNVIWRRSRNQLVNVQTRKQ